MRGILGSLLLIASVTGMPVQAEPFWWGIATSPYQTEDAGNFKTDWDLFYESGRLKDSKRNGTRSYSETERDLAAIEWLGVSHYRFGIEWARVEPQPGVYDEAAIEHYVQLARELVEHGITPVVCLWHFTFPDWASNLKHPSLHGWMNPTLQTRWPIYVRMMTERLSPYVRYYMPQNEPNVVALMGLVGGDFSPGFRGHLGAYRHQMKAAANAFNLAADTIKQAQPDAQIVTIQHMAFIQVGPYHPTGLLQKLADEFNYRHLDLVRDHTDIIGFNYYFKINGKLGDLIKQKRQSYPQGLRYFIEQLTKRYHKPLMITENGARTDNEDERRQYLLDHVAQVRKAVAEGYDIRGYFYWSLLDNFEWSEGWRSHFGMFELTPKDTLLPRPAAEAYRAIVAAPRPVLSPLASPRQR